MKKLLIAAFLVTFVASAAPSFKPTVAHAQAQPVRAAVAPLPSFVEPGISPDGSTIAFVSGGDIWEVPARGGDARLLVSHPATESRPLFSPDGKRLAFTSTRTGGGDVYVLTLATGELTRLTFDDANELVSGWSAGRQVRSTSSRRATRSRACSTSIASAPTAARRCRWPPIATRPSISRRRRRPATSLAITARANAGSQWWRKGHSHLDESEIWIVEDGSSDRLRAGHERRRQRRVADVERATARRCYFMSDRSGAQNIWSTSARRRRRPNRSPTFTDGRVLWPSISKDGKTIAFERDFGIWTVGHAGRTAARGRRSRCAARRRQPRSSIAPSAIRFRSWRCRPTAKKIAFTVHGEIFSASAKDGGDADARHQRPPAKRPSWHGRRTAGGSRTCRIATARNHLFLYDFATGGETQLTSGRGRDDMPRFSPDGKWIAFERDSRELRVIDPATKARERSSPPASSTRRRSSTRATSHGRPTRGSSPIVSAGAKTFANVQRRRRRIGRGTAFKAGEGRAVSFLANTNAGSLSWSPDGTLPDVRHRRSAPSPATSIRIDLLPRTPKFREDQFRDLFREEQPKTTPEPSNARRPILPLLPNPRPCPRRAAQAEAASRSSSTTSAAARRRCRSGVDVDASGDQPGRQVAAADGERRRVSRTCYVYLDRRARRSEPAVARQLTSTPGAEAQRALHAPTARRSTTWIAAACST